VSLLFDENISRKLVARLADLYPAARHVVTDGLERASDTEIWSLAAADGLVVVTRDSDFMHRLLLSGPPPSIVWLRVGNASTEQIEHVLRRDYAKIARLLLGQTPSGLLIIDP
jgi:predicted nuclease of predicted toxin-antitoxin system